MPSKKTPRVKRKKQTFSIVDPKSGKPIDEEYDDTTTTDMTNAKRLYKRTDKILDEYEIPTDASLSTSSSSSSSFSKYRPSIMCVALFVALMSILGGIYYWQHMYQRYYDEIELRRLKHNEEMEKLSLEKKKVDADIVKHEVQKLIKEYEKQVEEINHQHELDIKKITTKHDFEMEKMRIDHNIQVQRIKETQKESITKMELEHQLLSKRDELTIEKKTELYELIIKSGFEDLEVERKQLDLRYTECLRAQQDVKSFPTSGWFVSRDEQKLQELKLHATNICKEHAEARDKLEKRLETLKDSNFKFAELAQK